VNRRSSVMNRDLHRRINQMASRHCSCQMPGMLSSSYNSSPPW
jgi:hypothetical protein